MMETVRSQVLEISVKLEYNISKILGKKLDIDIESSKSLGFKSTALSFNAKLFLLLDMQLLTKQEKEKLTLFASIRNQFAHNVAVHNFYTCFNILKDEKKRLYNLYKDILETGYSADVNSNDFSSDKEKEEFYENDVFRYYIVLLSDINKISENVINRLKIGL